MYKQWKKYNESAIMNLPDSGKKSEEDTQKCRYAKSYHVI